MLSLYLNLLIDCCCMPCVWVVRCVLWSDLERSKDGKWIFVYFDVVRLGLERESIFVSTYFLLLF